MLATGNPIIVRLHPGEYSPMSDDTLHYRVDREGHVVAIIGYNDDEQVFLIADPWNAEFGGERSGIWKMPYMQMPIELVDGTLDAMTIPVPWDMSVEYPERPGGEFIIKGRLTYNAPTPLSTSYYHLHECYAKINLPACLNLLDEQIKKMGDLGTFSPGETIEIEWKVAPIAEKIDGKISIQGRGIISNSDPYQYSDVIGNIGEASISITPERILVK